MGAGQAANFTGDGPYLVKGPAVNTGLLKNYFIPHHLFLKITQPVFDFAGTVFLLIFQFGNNPCL